MLLFLGYGAFVTQGRLAMVSWGVSLLIFNAFTITFTQHGLGSMMVFFFNITKPFFVGGALFLGAIAGCHAKKFCATSLDTMRSFQEISDIVRKEYIHPVQEDDLLEGALQGMLGALDPHSAYLNQKAYGEFLTQSKGEFGGIGIEVTAENGLIKIVSTIDNTPAKRAGLQGGDLILRVNDSPIFGMNLIKVVEKMRGKPNTRLSLYIKRALKDPFTVNLYRELIQIKSVQHTLLRDVGYVRISTFDEKTLSLFQKSLIDLVEHNKNIKGLVLDLRNNPGGRFEQALGVCDLLLDKGMITATHCRNTKENLKIYATKNPDMLKGKPIVILINEGSASASEIVAGALRDNRRALIMGTPSFGKGSVQSVRPLKNGGGIKLTTCFYKTPLGTTIQGKGIVPDIVVPYSALSVDGGGEDAKKDLSKKSPALLSDYQQKLLQDEQCMRAIDMVHGLSWGQKSSLSAAPSSATF